MATNVTLNNNALVTLAEYNDYFGQTSDVDNPSIAKDIINKASDLIERHCMRKLKAQKIRNEIHRRTAEVDLEQFPLISIQDVFNGFDIKTATGSSDGGSTTTLIDAALTESDNFWNGAELQVEIDPGVWERSQVDDFDAASDTITVLSVDAFSAAVASGDNYRLTQRDTTNFTLLTDDDFKDIDYDDGTVDLFSHWGMLVFTYFAGYTVVPDDLKHACNLQANAILNHRVNAGATALSVGGASKTPDKRNPFSHIVPEALDLLALYRKKVI